MSLLSEGTTLVDVCNEPPSNPDASSTDSSTSIKRRDFSVSEKVELLIKYDTLPKMSQSKAARELGISKQLVCRLLQQRADIMQAWLHNKDINRKRKRCGKDGEVETALKEWFDHACAEGVSITGPIMRKKAEELAKKLGKEDFVATDGWFSRWRKRENIILLGKSKSEGISEVPAGQWPEMLAAYSAECVYGPESSAIREQQLAQANSTSSAGNDLNDVPNLATPVKSILPSPTKRRDLSISDKLEVLTRYDALPQMSQSLAASRLGVSQPLLCKILKSRLEIELQSVQNSSRKRQRRGKDGEVETALKKWFDQAQKDGVSLSGPIMRKKAEELAWELGKREFVATDGWFSRWRKRENITTGKGRSLNEPSSSQEVIDGVQSEKIEDENKPIVETVDSQSVPHERLFDHTELDVKPMITSTTSDEQVSQFHSNPENDISEVLTAYSPECIYSTEVSSLNMSKSGFNDENEQELIQERLSILCCVNLSGAKRKLLVAGQRDKKQSFKNVRQLPIDYYFNDDGRLTPHIIFDWLMKWDRTLEHEIVLMMDDCQDLRSITSFQNLKFTPVPKNLRSSGIFAMVQCQIAELKRQRRRLKDCVPVSDSNVHSTDFLSVLHAVAQSWENVPARSIVERFVECGVLPGTIPNDRPLVSISASSDKVESDTTSDFVVDQHEASPPTNDEIRNALSVLTRAVYHRAEEFKLHYEYENLIYSFLTSG